MSRTFVNGRYGTWEILGYEGPWRLEIYRPHDPSPREPWNHAIRERHMCDGPGDESPAHGYGPGEYVPECGACWLNIPHTERHHRAEVERAARSLTTDALEGACMRSE